MTFSICHVNTSVSVNSQNVGSTSEIVSRHRSHLCNFLFYFGYFRFCKSAMLVLSLLPVTCVISCIRSIISLVFRLQGSPHFPARLLRGYTSFQCSSILISCYCVLINRLSPVCAFACTWSLLNLPVTYLSRPEPCLYRCQ